LRSKVGPVRQMQLTCQFIQGVIAPLTGLLDKSSAWREIMLAARIVGAGGAGTKRANQLPLNVRSDRVS